MTEWASSANRDRMAGLDRDIPASHGSSMIQIDVYSDTVCPWCYIGKRRLERALAARDDVSAHVVWHAFQLNPDIPAEGLARERYLSGKYGNPDRAGNIYGTIARAGHAERIPFAFEAIRTTPNTVQSHRLVRLAERHDRQDAAVEALFRAYFLDGEDIGDDGVLARIAHAVGIERDVAAAFLAGDDERAPELEDEVAELRR